MRYFALDVALTSTTSTVLTYTCGVAYALLTLALLVRYVHNLRARGLGVMKLSMLLLLGYIVYSGTRAMTLLYSAVVGRISNTMLILPTAWYLLLMGFMARLWSMYLNLLLKEKQHRASMATIVGGGGGGVNNSSFSPALASSLTATAGHSSSLFSQRATAYAENANSFLVPSATAAVVTTTSPSSSYSVPSSSPENTNSSTTTHEDTPPAPPQATSFSPALASSLTATAGHSSLFSQRATAYAENANSFLVPSATAAVVTTTSPSSSYSVPSSSPGNTNSSTTTHEDTPPAPPQATPPPAAVPRTLAAAAHGNAPSPLFLTATALSQQRQHSPPSSPTTEERNSSRWWCSCDCQCITDHPLSFAVIVVSAISASIIFSLGIMCSNVTSLEHSHCVDIPSIADVAACWACGALMVVLAYRLRKCGADVAMTPQMQQQSSSSPTSSYHHHHSYHHPQGRLPPRSTRPPPHLANLAMASSSYSVPWVSSGASLSVASSSDPDFDQYQPPQNSINTECSGTAAAAVADSHDSSASSSCCSCRPNCCVSFVSTCGSVGKKFFFISSSYQSLHARTVAAAFLFGGYTITRGCTVASNIFAAEKSNLTHHDEEYLTPAFYMVEWICLVLCARLIVGPPRTSSSSLS
ncbi:membrane-associated protein, putative [Bodo saltans]|uniref:Membrane-associated protein, putative n=1 Tax=Bodo saltans TaxID=75058 RepID=A0A0S4JEX4_BODSA|nr:membrane-associated protein, putative [Bodo saltans]|eukprot:CUG88838.1 membrane-associated protein, putative [Bodo saltans]